jgi:hypothetical protein
MTCGIATVTDVKKGKSMKIKAICPHCRGLIELDPAAIMGRQKKTMTEEAKAQRKAAVSARWEKWRKDNPDKVKKEPSSSS